MQRFFEGGTGPAGRAEVAPVGLVDRDGIRHFNDTAFDSLEFVPGPCDFEQQKEIDHAVDGRFALAHAHRFYQDDLVASRFAQADGLPGLPGNPAQGISGRGRADKCALVPAQFVHPGLVAQDASLTPGAAGIHGEHSNPVAFARQVEPELFDKSALACPGHPGDPDADAFCPGLEAGFHQLVSIFPVRFEGAFHQRNAPCQGRPVGGAYAIQQACQVTFPTFVGVSARFRMAVFQGQGFIRVSTSVRSQARRMCTWLLIMSNSIVKSSTGVGRLRVGTAT